MVNQLLLRRLLVFGAGNHEPDFIGCLTYCLLQLTADVKIMLDTNMKAMWHVNPQVEASDDRLTSHQGHNLMAVAATRVWEELYACKKPAIEEVFKITLPAPVGHERAPELSLVRDHVHEAATRLWLNYVVIERKASYRVPWELHNQIQSASIPISHRSLTSNPRQCSATFSHPWPELGIIQIISNKNCE